MSPNISVINFEQNVLDTKHFSSLDDALKKVNNINLTWVNIPYLQTDAAGKALNAFGIEKPQLLPLKDRPHEYRVTDHEEFIVIEIMITPDSPEHDFQRTEDIVFIMGNNFLLTMVSLPGTISRAIHNPRLKRLNPRNRHAAFLFYFLIKYTLLDNYENILGYLLRQAEQIDDVLILEPNRSHKKNILSLREEIKPLRDNVIALKNVMVLLHADDFDPLMVKAFQYYKNIVHRHVFDMYQEYIALRELIKELMDMHRSNITDSTNQIIRILTVFSTIFLPITFITGFYGMNFEFMPELKVWWAYPLVIFIIVIISLSMLIYMIRKKWF